MPHAHNAIANPLSGNPLRSRIDLANALQDLFNPLLPYFSAGGARVRLGSTAAFYDATAVELEGFARPLWGLAPWAAGGGHFAHWDLYREGLSNGTDPDHPEYWGAITGIDQRIVELAAIGFALLLIPHVMWEPLTTKAKKNLANYLLLASAMPLAHNNWKFFKLLIDLGLEEVGVKIDPCSASQCLADLDSFYLGDGWYRDGNVRRVDHYVGFSMHFYGLLYARFKQNDHTRCKIFRERAALFAQSFQHWFDSEGGSLAFGRSLTYRFASGAMWGALSLAEVEGLSHGFLKGQLLRHLRWWSQYPIADRDGILSVGYGYPNLLMSEIYNSPSSPYWAFKTFLPLMLAADHPFWQAEELPFTPTTTPIVLTHPGMIIMHTASNVSALSSGQEYLQMRGGSEKYAKFIYSSRYAFSVESDERMFPTAVFDGMIGFSDNGRHFRARERNDVAIIADNLLFAVWRPWPDVVVETWLIPEGIWHIRVHRVNTPRSLHCTEGGFAIAQPEHHKQKYHTSLNTARAEGKSDISAICDLSPKLTRTPHVHLAPPNTHLLHPKTVVPQLRSTLNAGVHILIAAVAAAPISAATPADGTNTTAPSSQRPDPLSTPPAAPDIRTLEEQVKRYGVEVSAIKVSS